MMSTKFQDELSSKLVTNLHDVLNGLTEFKFPYVPSPGSTKKRASVALIIRINPTYNHWPSQNAVKIAPSLDEFFEQDWVQFGEPEALFIKRAARQGDRWQGHVALPGGGRDPEDVDDQAAAIRESAEEVGIDLSDANAISIGNLPQRLVTSSWGKVPIMVLCPYVFLITRHKLAPLRLQPTEIASVHWVPLKALLRPELRTYELQDVSMRFSTQRFGLLRYAVRAALGRMMFAAIRLIPSESIHCSSISGFLPDEKTHPLSLTAWMRSLTGSRNVAETSSGSPLHLWGLTLGVIADFLEFLPPHEASLEFWTYPNFTPPDLRFIIWALSYRFRTRKAKEVGAGHYKAGTPRVELGLDAVPAPDTGAVDERPPQGTISGLGTGGLARVDRRERQISRSSTIGQLLEGYYDIIRKGVALTLAGRTIVLVGLTAYIWRKYQQ